AREAGDLEPLPPTLDGARALVPTIESPTPTKLPILETYRVSRNSMDKGISRSCSGQDKHHIKNMKDFYEAVLTCSRVLDGQFSTTFQGKDFPREKMNWSQLSLKADPLLYLILSSWATGLCEDLIKQNKGESRYKVDGTDKKCNGHRQDSNLRYL
ncbi:hypothetical protein J6590_101778, partial [Homalodisca vitripennis]